MFTAVIFTFLKREPMTFFHSYSEKYSRVSVIN